MSIVPPFTWEAIMGPGHVDQLTYVLGLAREKSSRRISIDGIRTGREDNGVVRKIEGDVLRLL
jgi:hypothetical protein